MRRAFSLLTSLILLVVGGLSIQQTLAGSLEFDLFGFRSYPLPELTLIKLGPVEVSAALLLVGLVVLLLGGTFFTAIALALWTSRTSHEMARQRALPRPSGPAYNGAEKAPTHSPISDHVAVAVVVVAVILGALWAFQRAGSPLPAFGTVSVPVPRISEAGLELTAVELRANALFGALVGGAVLSTVGVGAAIASWFKRTTEEMGKEAQSRAGAKK